MESYWARREKQEKQYIESRDLYDGWFDYWHTHPDFYSKGNRYPESHSAVGNLTYRLLLHIDSLLKARNTPYQTWATICEDTGNNAIYLHTPNPNDTPFPHLFDGAVWSIADVPGINLAVDHKCYEIGKIQYDDEILYVIRKREE